MEYLIPSDNMMIILSIRLFHFLRLKFQSQKIKLYLIEERDDKSFRYSHILKRDDEIFIRYINVQQTIEWIIEYNSFKDIISYVELKQIYGLYRHPSNDFLHLKENYIKIVKALPFMISETFFFVHVMKYLITISGIISNVALLINKIKN